MADASTKKRERVKVTISGDAMTATLLALPPHEGDEVITAEEIQEAIEHAGISFGIKDDIVSQICANVEFNKPIVIAEGVRPRKGESSSFEYMFDTTNTHKPVEDDDGRIDYRNINFIQNIEKGATLATKIPATPGIPGRTVRNKELKAPSGRDIPFNKGVNTEVSPDGLSLKATASGAIMYQHGKISVNDLTVINGNLDHQVGNIECRGSVRVMGHIKAGYSVKVDGDLEVAGNVEDAMLEIGGNISVKGGFFGKGSGFMKAGGDITLKYAEGQRLEAAGNISIGGEVINCDLLAKGNVVFSGPKGKIIGGETKAGKEITAAEIGSDAGTITHLYVAYNPELMRQHAEILAEIRRLKADGARVKDALYNLYKADMAGKLPADKKPILQKLSKFQEELPATLVSLDKEREQVEAQLREYDDARVIARDLVHSGVTVHFGVVYKDITDDHKSCSITIQDGKILLSRDISA